MSEDKQMEKRNVATSVREREDDSFDAGVEKAAGMFGGAEKRASAKDDRKYRRADEEAELG